MLVLEISGSGEAAGQTVKKKRNGKRRDLTLDLIVSTIVLLQDRNHPETGLTS